MYRGKEATCRLANNPQRDNVLTVKALTMRRKKGKAFPDSPYNWNENSIVAILERMDYWRER